MERLMQYVWQHRIWPQTNIRTVDGRRLQIIDPGLINTGSGPDFFNAKVVIDGRTWVGDVEIHVRASDWHRHGHDGDRAYDSVILHVVDRDDTIIRRSNGEEIPQMQMTCTPDFNARYNELVLRADRDLPCASRIPAIPSLYLTDWLQALAFERIYEKTDRINNLLERTGGDWESTCYITIARSLGFGTNGDAFERLALSLPLMFVGKHSDSLFAIEALLFGQSGLLDSAPAADDYASRLKQEYTFMAHKFGLRQPVGGLPWKMRGTRPANFPHRRIATLAAMLYGGFRMMSRILDIRTIDDARRLFNPELTGYWTNHYSFSAPSGRTSSGELSASTLAGLIINSVVPLQYAYGIATHCDTLTDSAIELLESLPAERNTIVELFGRAGIKARDAFTSQALIQLRRSYCETRKCLYCRIGHRMLTAAVQR